jgi:tRNA threonylcarbamoyladenosine biosynthesis protein TsaB
MPLNAELLGGAGTSWEQLDRIAVGVGPGTFTGLRVGVATARALSQSTQLPLVAVSTLQALSLNAGPDDGVSAVLAVLDARRGEMFAGAWAATGSREPLIEPAVFRPDALADLVPRLGPRTLAIGEGAVEFRAILERPGALIPDERSELHRVTARRHCRLARSLEPSDRDEIRPEYLRLPDAELARRAAAEQ